MRKIYIFILIFVFLFLFINLTTSFAKHYSFPRMWQEVKIMKNGDIDVTEYRTYEFDGNFHWASYTLAPGGYSSLSDIWVGELQGSKIIKFEANSTKVGGYTFKKVDDGGYAIKWYYDKANEKATFVIHFTAHDVIKVYNDVAEFYWKFVGTGWDRTVKFVKIRVILPDGDYTKDDIKIFAHGPLWGEVHFGKEPREVIYTVKNLSSFFEGRILMPPSLFPTAKNKIDKNAYDFIMEQELKWAKEADIKRENAKKILVMWKWIAYILFIVIPLLFLIWIIYDYFKYGKEYKPQFFGDYYRDLPSNDPPALVSYLMKFGQKAGGTEFTATVMDLVRRGYLRLEEVEREKRFLFTKKRHKDYILYINDKDQSDLLSYERDIIDLFKYDIGKRDDGGFSLEEFKKYAKKNKVEMHTFFEEWAEKVKKIAKERNFIELQGKIAQIRWIIVSILYEFASLMLLLFLAPPSIKYQYISLFFISMGIFVIIFIFSFQLRRRSKEAVELFAKWKAFKRFLQHFSNMKEAVPRSIIVWEHYLVYAIVLGVAKEVIKQLSVLIKEGFFSESEIRDSYLFGMFYHNGGIRDFSSGLSSLESSISSLSDVASSAYSSSGSGGGASGGGGGGGGGSGGGAG